MLSETTLLFMGLECKFSYCLSLLSKVRYLDTSFLRLLQPTLNQCCQVWNECRHSMIPSAPIMNPNFFLHRSLKWQSHKVWCSWQSQPEHHPNLTPTRAR